jgi:Flp pilus assembly protein TadD
MADELFARALALAPQEPSALLGRAALAAKLGDRDLARASLDQLLKHQPDHREARLRRALLADREGDARGAEAALAELARGAQTDWITALAYQELGRLLLERRQTGRAIAVLAEGSGRLPREQSLLVALAYLYERSGRTSALQAVLARLEPQTTADISPRLRFSQAPAAEIAELRQALLAAALLRQGELAAVLGPARAPAGGG